MQMTFYLSIDQLSILPGATSAQQKFTVIQMLGIAGSAAQ